MSEGSIKIVQVNPMDKGSLNTSDKKLNDTLTKKITPRKRQIETSIKENLSAN